MALTWIAKTWGCLLPAVYLLQECHHDVVPRPIRPNHFRLASATRTHETDPPSPFILTRSYDHHLLSC